MSLLRLILLAFPGLACASTSSAFSLNLIAHPLSYLACGLFVVAYLLVMGEEFLDLKKSKPVLLAGGLIWLIVYFLAQKVGQLENVQAALHHSLTEFALLFLFLLSAMTYVNAMQERGIFEALRGWLVSRNYSYRQLFWVTGILAFFISPLADNLTTALVMCAVLLAIGQEAPTFIALGCINIVVAANAGGAFSPFGDITTLMVWAAGHIPFQDFFKIFLPSVVNYIIPALCMTPALPKGTPPALESQVQLRPGALGIVILFLITVMMTVTLHNTLHIPAALGMMIGLSFLKFYAYYLRRCHGSTWSSSTGTASAVLNVRLKEAPKFDIMEHVRNAEWDTLLFFNGVMLCVGGLATLGYLGIISDFMYHDLGQGLSAAHLQTPANILIGVLSALVDNIPVMYAVLSMEPLMSEGQWLLVTLTAGTGGSLLSIGSAAGVALMGQAHGHYTFMRHLRWTWAVALGYAASIALHLVINAATF